MMYRSGILVLALFLLAPGRVQAQTAGASFLRIGAGARAAGLGGAYTALATGADALYWNPAGLSGAEQPTFGFTHTNWILGLKHDYFAASMPAERFGSPWRGNLALGVTRLGASGVDSRDASGAGAADLTASDAAYALGAGFSGLPYGLTGGASLKLIQSRVGSFSATTFAADIGVQKRAAVGALPVEVGLSARNIGPGLKFNQQRDPLPATLTLGLGTEIQRTFKLALDVNYEPNDSRLSAGFGSEFSPVRALSVRAGYLAAASQGAVDDAGSPGLSGIAGGLGLTISRYRLDYAFTPFNELGGVHRIGLSTDF